MGKTVDIDGITYNVIQVGSQLWLNENLNSTSHRKGYSWPNSEYGRLYNWEAAMTLNLPDGWRLPTIGDWEKMFQIKFEGNSGYIGDLIIPADLNIQMGGWGYILEDELGNEFKYVYQGKDVKWITSTLGGLDDEDLNGRTNNYIIDYAFGKFYLSGQTLDEGCSVRLVYDMDLKEHSNEDIFLELKNRGYIAAPDIPERKVLKSTIVDPLDLFKYSIALVNSGVTYESIEVLERQILPLLFGVDGAERLLEYLAENTTEEKTEPLPTDDTYDFSGSAEVPRIIYNYGEVDELIKGDGKLFAGLKALLATLICTNLLSQNRVQVARQNVTKQPVNSRQTNRKEDSEVVQALCFTAHSIICALARFLKKEGKNPLDLNVDGIIEATRYSVNVSGKMPSNWLNIWGWF